MTVPAFAASYEILVQPNTKDDRESAKKALTCLQTVVRKLRRELNAYARERGFMLSDQFVHDADQLASRHVNGGKAGDLGRLAKLASKKSDTRMLSLIHLRNQAHPSKITRFSSVQEILGSCKTKSDDAEVAALERGIFVARLQATIRHLSALVQNKNKSVVVASLENQSELNHAAAILVAAALSNSLELSPPTGEPVAVDATATSDVEETPVADGQTVPWRRGTHHGQYGRSGCSARGSCSRYDQQERDGCTVLHGRRRRGDNQRHHELYGHGTCKIRKPCC